jgi:membrane-associated protease RseP (regulator of RpoE activity)
VLAGISATIVVPHPGFIGSIEKAPGGVITVAHEAVSALGSIFSPSGMSKYFHVLAGTDKNKADQNTRFLSPIGFATVAAHAVDAGWLAVVGLLLVINVFVGLVNLVPLLPFDGGHIAIAVFEKIRNMFRSLRGMAAAAPVNYLKLMPATYVVLLVVVGYMLLTVTADVVNPIRLFQ